MARTSSNNDDLTDRLYMSNDSQKESAQQLYEKVRLLFCVDGVKWDSYEFIK
ncbi:hypothetical protein ACIQAA_04280 [Neobacillus sp. NPDC093182]|uniref:hypothetical protein n=1 Tax=Neobacillus sp. NPDC093182 TaxID=3364297 RepID=UPI0038298BC6